MDKPPPKTEVESDSWSLQIDGIPVIQDIDKKIYDHVHSPIAKAYWTRKDRIAEPTFPFVTWSRLGSALDKMPVARRIFCSKHTMGMCGVGKFQKIWKLRETDACPHCGCREDSLHVWTCRSPAVVALWDQELITIRNYLQKIDTDPTIIEGILHYLKSWRSDQLLQPLHNSTMRRMLLLQDTIGRRQFFEGWLHSERDKLQQQFYIKINSRRNGKRWTIAVSTKMWE